MRKQVLIAVTLVVLAPGVAAWAHRDASQLDRSRDRALAKAAALQDRTAALDADLAAVGANGRADAAAAVQARRAVQQVVVGAARVEARLRAALRASRALADAQSELTTVGNRVVDLLNAGQRDRAGALLEGEARRRETEVARALEAEREAAAHLRRAVARYREAAR